MSPLEILLPSVIATLFATGGLTALLRRSRVQVLFGILLMGWATVLLLTLIASRAGSPEGFVLAICLTVILGLQGIAGISLIGDEAKP